MHPNEELLTRFYTAFGKADAATMGSCYAPETTFSDPVFTGLHGADVPKMWRMLCSRAADLAVAFEVIGASDAEGRATWVATYSFSGTGRKVVNRIDSAFVFRDGLIAAQHDSFNLYRWTRQALGIKGLLLGWLPPFQAALQRQARARLDAFKG